MLKTSQAHNHGKYDNNGKGWYLRFDDDNYMSYIYIYMYMYIYIYISFQSHRTEMGQLNTYNPIYCNENKK